ncbi:MAG: hypothetical protein LBQ08_02010 [Holosporaceae bacterium]|jgi:hypothetical protein|nr:hypothetical protein [Holosporaceae bacterium]
MKDFIKSFGVGIAFCAALNISCMDPCPKSPNESSLENLKKISQDLVADQSAENLKKIVQELGDVFINCGEKNILDDPNIVAQFNAVLDILEQHCEKHGLELDEFSKGNLLIFRKFLVYQ